MNECKKESCPEFVELMEALNEQLYQIGEHSSLIFEKVNKIKDVREPDKCVVKEEAPKIEGFIGELWVCIGQMKRQNSLLNQSGKALIRLVGKLTNYSCSHKKNSSFPDGFFYAHPEKILT